MPLASGTRLGPYEILSALGAGGMGEVYKARDTRLDRSVAIKVLPPDFTSDPDRRARFEREAKTVAGLSHPHICSLFDVGDHDGAMFLVMEHLAGQTLAERLEQGPLPLNQALTIATEIAEALAAAHRQGVIHRDLKPANVMLTKSGAKLLDFGLAKLKGHGDQPAAPQVASMPTRSTPLTAEGVIVGTLQYMAPEQVEGKPADARTDLWALGAILYEMLTGKRAFEGASAASLITAIMGSDPPALAMLQPLTPPGVERIVRRCLAKQPDDRLESAHDLADELRWVRETSTVSPATAVQRTPRIPRRGRWVAIGIGGCVIVAAFMAWRIRQPQPSPQTANAAVHTLTSDIGIETQPSFSPDGGKIAFAWNGDKGDNFDIYVKQIGLPGPPVPRTTSQADENMPAWSPDDRWIAFARRQPDRHRTTLLMIPSGGGPERWLAETETDVVGGLCWTPEAKWLVFSERDAEGRVSLTAVQVDTLARHNLTTFPRLVTTTGGLSGDLWPSVSPDGQWLAFVRGTNYVYDLHLLALTPDLQPAGQPRQITDEHYGGSGGITWSANSREVVYAAGDPYAESLWRVSVSDKQPPRRLPFALPDVSFPVIAPKTSRLAYAWRVFNQNLWRLDLQTGDRGMLVSSTYSSQVPQYSPNGRRIAFQSNRSLNREVWICDAADGKNCVQLTSFGGPQCGTPRWSPDGLRIALDSRVEGQSEIYVVAADGGTPQRLTFTPGFNNTIPSWSHDGSWLYFTSNRSGRNEIWKMPAAGGPATQSTRAGGSSALSSPDGKYLYYIKGPTAPGLFRMAAEGGQEEQVLTDAIYWSGFGVTAKGVYFSAGGTLKFLDTATGRVKPLGVVADSGGLCASPDDRYVVWSQTDRNTTDLMMVEGFR